MPKVTAIVSAYFAAEYLEGRIENLLAQEPQPEIVVVCQGDSKEYEIARKFQGDATNEANFFICLTRDIPTIYAAWNMGIEMATGEYITNANSDDRLYSGALKALADALDANPKKAVAYADCDIVERVGGDAVGVYEWAEGGILELLKGCFLGPFPMWRKSLHDKYGLFDAEMYSAGDYEFWLRLAKGGEKFHHVRRIYGAYLKRSDSAEHRQKLRTLWETARAKGRYREGVGIWRTPAKMTD